MVNIVIQQNLDVRKKSNVTLREGFSLLRFFNMLHAWVTSLEQRKLWKLSYLGDYLQKLQLQKVFLASYIIDYVAKKSGGRDFFFHFYSFHD